MQSINISAMTELLRVESRRLAAITIVTFAGLFLAACSGSAGIDGATGPQGQPGPEGSQGGRGLDGAVGPAGEQGEPGPAGKTTVLDLTGPIGPKGPKGDSGDAGQRGEIGPQGSQGDTGLTGVAGATGALGVQGEPGADGLDGDPAHYRDRSRPPLDHIISVVDQGPQLGSHTAIAVGTDGMPVIAYRDEANLSLKFVHCGTEDCSTGNAVTTLDNDGNVGRGASIAINTAGFPIISYRASIDGFLRVLSCGNITCTEGNQITDVDVSGDVSSKTSIMIGSDGFPVVSYRDRSNRALRILHCGDANCTSDNTLELVNDPEAGGTDSSLAIGVDGFPIISFLGANSNELVLVHCLDVTCEDRDIPLRIDASGIVGFDSSIAIGFDGLPVIAYRDNSSSELLVAHCGTVNCASGTTVATIDSDPNVGYDISITIGADGFPIISYADRELSILKFVHCGNAKCNSGNSVVVIDSTGSINGHTSITVGRDGLPIIAYRDETADALKVAHLGNPIGVPYFRRR